ncbi:MAG: DUF4446 family protein [Bacillota bacterium]
MYETLLALVATYSMELLLIILGVQLLLIIGLWGNGLALRRVVSRFRRLLATPQGSLEELLLQLGADLAAVRGCLEGLEARQLALERSSKGCLQRVALVRFNAFHNTGGELSFALALLDQQGSGLVISTIYGREETRTYAKAVTRGKSKHNLSAEEQAAIRQALESKKLPAAAGKDQRLQE